MNRGWVAVGLVFGFCWQCTSTTPAPIVHNDVLSWRLAHEQLQQLRQVWSPKVRSVPVRVQMRVGDGAFEGRGAIATSPPDDLRMILVGPAGTTAMDLWVDGPRWRLAIPAADRVSRGAGGGDGSDTKGLPVGFLRWWLLHPFEGELLAVTENQNHILSYVLRGSDGAAYEIVAQTAGDVAIVRRHDGHVERISASQPDCVRARYHSDSPAVALSIECDRSGTRSVPDPRAFRDPDQPVSAGVAAPDENP